MRRFLGAGLIAGLLTVAGCHKRVDGAAVDPRVKQFPAAASAAWNAHILVDQFGYRPQDAKVAVIREAHVGFDAADGFKAGKIYDVRRATDGQLVFSGVLDPWNGGAIEPTSGDSGWWFDFSTLRTPGDYYVLDVSNNVRSPVFTIGAGRYRPMLKAAMRMFFHQRSGMKKSPPYTDECWADEPAYLGKNQDTEAHDATDPGNPAKVRDLSGGWFDAGDTNKYVTYAVPVVHQLLTAFEHSPTAFTDDFGIPESGNGIPDVLDEVKWEIDWLKKMQMKDGSAALKVGEEVIGRASPPSSDASPRFYVPSCTSSTIAVAGMFAHASQVYSTVPALAPESRELRIRAAAAWHNFSQQPQQYHCDTGLVRAGNADWDATDQNSGAVVAAVYLFAVTGEASYGDYVKAHYRELRPYRDYGWARYNAEQGDALMAYAMLPTADAGLKRQILDDRRADVTADNGVYGFDPQRDLYRAFMPEAQFHWGSNQIHANYGNVNMDVIYYDLGIHDDAPYRSRALETLHYFHGVNPLSIVYLSNMYRYGATRSVNEIFHAGYARYSSRVNGKLDSILHKLHLDAYFPIDLKSRWNDARTSECGPPPGFVPGGPNKDAQQNGVPATVSPPVGQPPQKSYRDWNIDWPDASWTVTEPAIYYQAAYVKLVSSFAD